MEHIPLASVATRKFEDTASVKAILARLEAAIHLEGGFSMSSEAQFAMGWWFFDIRVSPLAMKKMLEQDLIRGRGMSAADQLISRIQTDLASAGCDARVKRASKPSIFARYWSWLIK